MTQLSSFPALSEALLDFIESSLRPEYHDRHDEPGAVDGCFNELALALFRLQVEAVAPLRQLCIAREIRPDAIQHWTDIPAIPTEAFKTLDLTSLSPADRIRTFHSSGTTHQQPSRHFHSDRSLGIYEASALPWFERHLMNATSATGGRMEPAPAPRFIFLTPSPNEAPHSSLVCMFGMVARRFGARNSVFAGTCDSTGEWKIDPDRILQILADAADSGERVILCGTAFSFVQFLDRSAGQPSSRALPEGSVVMETGGYKGRSRSLSKEDLHRSLSEALGVPRSRIVSEYGMSELGSQAYDGIAGAPDSAEPAGRVFRFPPWARVRVVSPETGGPVVDGEAGLLQVFDLANVYSVLAVQTGDLAVGRDNGFELLGRAATSEPRGCSLMMGSMP
ncbi:MAG TPA: acyl-protein synthetase [Methylomirabilota bacterium]|nr:acyl-protein synthetase [Methylomirabilota bacterium]